MKFHPLATFLLSLFFTLGFLSAQENSKDSPLDLDPLEAPAASEKKEVPVIKPSTPEPAPARKEELPKLREGTEPSLLPEMPKPILSEEDNRKENPVAEEKKAPAKVEKKPKVSDSAIKLPSTAETVKPPEKSETIKMPEKSDTVTKPSTSEILKMPESSSKPSGGAVPDKLNLPEISRELPLPKDMIPEVKEKVEELMPEMQKKLNQNPENLAEELEGLKKKAATVLAPETDIDDLKKKAARVLPSEIMDKLPEKAIDRIPENVVKKAAARIEKAIAKKRTILDEEDGAVPASIALFNEELPRDTVLMRVAFNGNIRPVVIRLVPEKAPATVANFKKLVSERYYDGIAFHRAIPHYLVQAGDPQTRDPRTKEEWGTKDNSTKIPAELGLPHEKGAIAMARLSDPMNPDKSSSGSQFYITLDELPELDDQYTVFGKVVKGFSILKEIAALDGDTNDVPLQRVEIVTMDLVPNGTKVNDTYRSRQKKREALKRNTRPEHMKSSVEKFIERIW